MGPEDGVGREAAERSDSEVSALDGMLTHSSLSGDSGALMSSPSAGSCSLHWAEVEPSQRVLWAHYDARGADAGNSPGVWHLLGLTSPRCVGATGVERRPTWGTRGRCGPWFWTLPGARPLGRAQVQRA